MITARSALHAIALPDGRVIVIGEDQGAEIWDPATNAWKLTAGLNFPRTNFAAVGLADGRVLVTGGLNDIEQSYSSAYVFDVGVGGGQWTKVGLMDTARTGPAAALLPDGRVLVAGGYFHVQPTSGLDTAPLALLAAYRPEQRGSEDGSGGVLGDIPPPNVGAALATAELFDPTTGTWSMTGPLAFARYGAAAVTLADGRILVVGSRGTDGAVTVDGGAFDSAEIYDPETGRFTLAGTFPAIDRQAMETDGVVLPDFGPAPMSVGRLVALSDGGAVLIANTGAWKHLGDITRSFRFDAGTASWRELAKPYAYLNDPGTGETSASGGTPRFYPLVTRLADGRVLVAGGNKGGGYANVIETEPISLTNASAVVYDPVADAWSAPRRMPEPRAFGAAVALSDGSVILVGGQADRFNGQFVDSQVLATAVRLIPSP